MIGLVGLFLFLDFWLFLGVAWSYYDRPCWNSSFCSCFSVIFESYYNYNDSPCFFSCFFILANPR